MNNFLLLLLYIFGLLVFTSCNKEKLKSPEASFLVAKETPVNITASQKSNSHKITDLWLYVNDQFQGTYPIGSVMPIVAKDNASILLYAGIKNNGISATRMPYPFYKGVSFNQSLKAGETYTITPNFSYISNLFFLADDNFESSGFQFKSVGDSAYSIISNPALTYGGTGKSIFMSMSNSKPTAEMRMSSTTYLPAGGATIYMEMDYKCNQSISVGIIGGASDTREVIVLNPSTEWNKIYIQLTSAVSRAPFYNYYDIYIKAVKSVDNPQIYIDNVKLIAQ